MTTPILLSINSYDPAHHPNYLTTMLDNLHRELKEQLSTPPTAAELSFLVESFIHPALMQVNQFLSDMPVTDPAWRHFRQQRHYLNSVLEHVALLLYPTHFERLIPHCTTVQALVIYSDGTDEVLDLCYLTDLGAPAMLESPTLCLQLTRITGRRFEDAVVL